MKVGYSPKMESNFITVEPGDTLEGIICLARSGEVRAVEGNKFVVKFPPHKVGYYTKIGVRNSLRVLNSPEETRGGDRS